MTEQNIELGVNRLNLNSLTKPKAEIGSWLTEKEKVLCSYQVDVLDTDSAKAFGDHNDGVIEYAAIVERGGVIEAGYYYGSAKPKSIVKVSTQVGCPMRCTFCNLGEESFGRNLTEEEIYQQVALTLQFAEQHGVPSTGLPHKVNFAGSGESLLNPNLIPSITRLRSHGLSFKVSTVFPSSLAARRNFEELAKFAGENAHDTVIQIQVSLISTDPAFRSRSAGGHVANLAQIREAAELWRSYKPAREQINLSLILADQTPVDPHAIKDLFPPEHFRFRFRNYVPSENGISQGLNPMPENTISVIKRTFRDIGYYVGDEATPTGTEQAHSLASNNTRRSEMNRLNLPIVKKKKATTTGDDNR